MREGSSGNGPLDAVFDRLGDARPNEMAASRKRDFGIRVDLQGAFRVPARKRPCLHEMGSEQDDGGEDQEENAASELDADGVFFLCGDQGFAAESASSDRDFRVFGSLNASIIFFVSASISVGVALFFCGRFGRGFFFRIVFQLGVGVDDIRGSNGEKAGGTSCELPGVAMQFQAEFLEVGRKRVASQRGEFDPNGTFHIRHAEGGEGLESVMEVRGRDSLMPCHGWCQ